MEAAVVGAVAGVGSGIVGGPTVGAAVGLVSGALTVAVKSWMTVPTPAAEEEPQKKPKKKFVKPEPKVEEPEEEEKEKGLSAGQKRRLLEKKKKDDAKAKEEEAKKAAAAAKKAGKGKNAKGGKAEAKDNKPELAAAGSPAIKGASAPAQKAAAAAPAKSNAAPPAKTSAAEPAAEDAKKKKKKKKSAAAAKPEEAGDGGASASSSSGADVVVTGADEWQQQPSQLREAKRGALAAAKREKADAAKAATGAAAVSEAIEVPSKDHAAIIGKGGQMVRDLMAATGTKITVPRKESGQQFITVEGDKPNIERVRKAIKQIIATGLSDETHPGHVQNAIEIPASASGLLVGSKGETRKLLEDRLGVKITVPEKDENSKTALIKLQGPDAEVENAKAEIRRLVEDGFNSYVNPNWVKLQVVFPQTHLKHLFGAKGQALKDLQIATKTKINVPPKGERQTGPYANTVIITIVGPPTGVQDAREEMSKTAAIVEEDMTPVLLDPEPAWAGPSANLSAQNEW